jgi:4-hydroxybenzoate polyprenyltransferase
MKRIKEWLDFVRWKDWGAGKLPFLLGVCFYAGLSGRLLSIHYIIDCLIFALLAATSSAYGYLINDFGDIEIDTRQGKRNAFAGWPRRRAVCFLVALAVLSAFLTLPFAARPWLLPLWVLWLGVSTAYSLPPLRFKERGIVGLIVPALAQQALPVLIAFAAFDQLAGLDVWLWVAYALSKGISLILLHQRRDLVGDRMTQTRTFATGRGERTTAWAASLALEVEKVLLWGLLLVSLRAAPTLILGGWSLNAALPLVFGYGPIYLISLVEGRRDRRSDRVHDPYHGPIRGATGTACVVWPVIVLPFYLLGLLTMLYAPYGLMLVGLAIFHLPYAPKVVRRLATSRRSLGQAEAGQTAGVNKR